MLWGGQTATAGKVTAIERESRSVETNIKNTQAEIDKVRAGCAETAVPPDEHPDLVGERSRAPWPVRLDAAGNGDGAAPTPD